MSLKSDFSFGEKVIVEGQLIRHKGPNGSRWWSSIKRESPTEAIFLGAYNLSNGHVDWEYSDDGGSSYFDHKTLIPGAWICIKGRKPEKVFLSDVHKFGR